MSRRAHARILLFLASTALVISILVVIVPAIFADQGINVNVRCSRETEVTDSWEECNNSAFPREPAYILLLGTVLSGFGFVIRRKLL